jgi:class 3 adenylate cyclase/tetratricopeptide (TPR) repeat protein
VLTCANCGRENPEGARFCNGCAAPLVAVPLQHEVRKTVSVLFCDVAGSTAMGETTDPEAVRVLLARYFERMKAIVERHGGSVEKFIGDAVMAVFGVPVAHEDDALRACRAAVEMRDALPELGIRGRIGVNTGEVVAGTEERLATGDAVNVAARLEQAASPGEVLIGSATFRLVRGMVEAEPVELLSLKGKAEQVPALRLASVLAVPERPHRSRFVGRERELRSILEAWQRSNTEQRCELVTVLGEAGVGKSRLVAEAVASIEARVVRGRCLPYGEGITYWPVVEVVRQLDALPSDSAAASSIRSLLGESKKGTSAEEISWAFRKLLEEQAPLVVVFDDVQWGEETFLDLLEGVVLLASGVPLLMLCMARPELLDRRASWPASSRLEPLPPTAVDELIGDQVGEGVRERITATAGGNPLFVTEMLAMAAETAAVEVPPSLRALLAARLDQLDPAERRVLERGAVEGEVFHRGAVQALAPEEVQVTPRLAALTRKQLIRPHRPQLPRDDGFRFRHLLIRDAAYDALPKTVRADLHERFADWLEEHGRTLVELDEIVGYHLEQAQRYQRELGLVDELASGLAKRAAGRLQAAGERASARGDMAAASNLFGRAVELVPLEDPARLELLPEWTAALTEAGELARAASILGPAITAAELAGNKRVEWRARLGKATAEVWMGASQKQTGVLAEQAAGALKELGDDLGLARALHLAGLIRLWLGSALSAEEAWWPALEHARRANSARDEAQTLMWSLVGSWVGPTPVEEAIQRCRDAVAAAPTRQVEAVALTTQGALSAMLGGFDQARQLFRRGKEMLQELGLAIAAAGVSQECFDIEMHASDPAAAEVELREACTILQRIGEKGFLSTRAALLAHALCAQGRHEEAVAFIELAAEAGAPDDLATQSLWRSASAKVTAQRGDHQTAERLVNEAVEIVASTDWLNLRGDAAIDLAEVLSLAGKREEEIVGLKQALELYERKGNVIMAQRTRTRLNDVQTSSADSAPN